MPRVLILFFLPIAAYALMLSSPFKTMDDQFSIVRNPLIQDTSQWPQLFTQGYFNDHSYYRPLVNLSFMAEYKMFGLNAPSYNLDNLLLHILNAFLVWYFAALLVNFEVGFWTALLFAVHPIQAEAVCNISGRAILLGTFFSLLSFIAYLKGRPFISLTAFATALLCKESSVILPGIMFVFARLNGESLRWVPPWAAVVVFYIGLRHILGITETFPWRNVQEYVLGFLTFLSSVLTHLRLFLFPLDLHFDRSMKLFSSVLDPRAFMTICIYIAGAWALWAGRKYLSNLHWLALVWFALSLLPVSQLLTTIGVGPGYISTAEHFLYFASIPIFLVVVEAIRAIDMKALNILGIGFLMFFFLISIEQSMYARSELAMMERSLQFQPHNPRLHSSVGLIYALSGKFVEAEGHFRAAVADDPFNARYQISLGKSLCDQGRYQECLAVYDQIQNPGRLAGLLQDNRRAALELSKAALPPQETPPETTE